jgi:hypothetical protein
MRTVTVHFEHQMRMSYESCQFTAISCPIWSALQIRVTVQTISGYYLSLQAFQGKVMNPDMETERAHPYLTLF